MSEACNWSRIRHLFCESANMDQYCSPPGEKFQCSSCRAVRAVVFVLKHLLWLFWYQICSKGALQIRLFWP
eukprot:362600-Amphidinium_carterae.1